MKKFALVLGVAAAIGSGSAMAAQCGDGPSLSKTVSAQVGFGAGDRAEPFVVLNQAEPVFLGGRWHSAGDVWGDGAKRDQFGVALEATSEKFKTVEGAIAALRQAGHTGQKMRVDAQNSVFQSWLTSLGFALDVRSDPTCDPIEQLKRFDAAKQIAAKQKTCEIDSTGTIPGVRSSKLVCDTATFYNVF
jgi:hypothetical protein